MCHTDPPREVLLEIGLRNVHMGQGRGYLSTSCLSRVGSKEPPQTFRPCRTIWMRALSNLGSKRFMDQQKHACLLLPLPLRFKHQLVVRVLLAQSSLGTTINQVTRCHLSSAFGVTVQGETRCTLTWLLELVLNTKHSPITGSPASRRPSKARLCRSLRLRKRQARLIGELPRLEM